MNQLFFFCIIMDVYINYFTLSLELQGRRQLLRSVGGGLASRIEGFFCFVYVTLAYNLKAVLFSLVFKILDILLW